MEILKKEPRGEFLAGIVAVLLLGEIIAILGMPIDDVVKFGKVIFDIGVAGAIWIFLRELFEGNGSEVYKAALAIAVAVLVAFAW